MLSQRQKLGIALASGVIALLLARVLVLLMAADPGHPFVVALLAVTEPLVWPLAWLDAEQPTTGVRFERAPLLLALLAVGLAGLISRWRGRATRT